MKFIKHIAAAAVLASAVSATAQVAFSTTLSAVGSSGVNGAFGGSVASPVPFGSIDSPAGGAGSASASGVVVIVGAPGPAVANPTTVTSGTLTGPGGFSAVINANLVSNVHASDGAVNQGTGSTPVYVDVRTLTYTLALASGTRFPVGNNTYTVTLFNGATSVATGSFSANVVVSPVPEPETYAAVAALGLVGFGLWRRRNA